MRIHWPYLLRKEQTKYLTTLKEKEADTHTNTDTHTLLTTVIQSIRKAFRSFR